MQDVTPGLDDSQFITVKCRQCSSHYPLREINKHMLQCVKTSKCVGWESMVSITTSDRLKYLSVIALQTVPNRSLSIIGFSQGHSG